MDLSVIIPARNEEFLDLTIKDVIAKSESETEVIAILDGYWPEKGIEQHSRVNIIHYEESIGQRAATNIGAKVSRAKFIMKLDAHCKVGQGFDRILIETCEYNWTVIPRMYNLHAFDWVCKGCGSSTYQGPHPKSCISCDNKTDFERNIVWKRRRPYRRTDFWRFDSEMKFNYWTAYGNRPEAKDNICDVMSSIGACFFMHRERFWDLGGMDEKHGSWGQFGTEVACKSWLSGGRHVVNKNTWFAHLFRTNSAGFSFPYKLKAKQVNKARRHSKDLWLNDRWDKAVRPLSWLIEKFAPVPGWEQSDIDKLKKEDSSFSEFRSEIIEKIPIHTNSHSKTLVYYTDNTGDPFFMETCRKQILNCMRLFNFPIICVSQKPLDFGKNIVMNLERSVLSIFKQILKGCQEADTKYIFLLEHDIIYHPSHFDFTPPRGDTFYYDQNRWSVCDVTGKSVFYHTDVPSMLCANRELLIRHYSKCVLWVEKEGWKSKYGYSPPKGLPSDQKEGLRETWLAEFPSLDVRRKESWSRKRMSRSQFRNPKSYRGWTESDVVPGWGAIKGRFNEFIKDVNNNATSCDIVPAKNT